MVFIVLNGNIMSRPLKKRLFGKTHVITFSSLPTFYPDRPSSYNEDGITAVSASGLFWGWPNPGEAHLDPAGFAGTTINFTFAFGTFTLSSLDIAYASAGAVATVTAFDALGAQLYTSNVDASTIHTESFTGWNNISSLSIVDSVNHLSIDNVTFNKSSEHIRLTANILGLSNNEAEIIRQMSSRKFLVRNDNGTAPALIHPTGEYYYGNCPNGYMFFYCTDNASARYVVSKISAHRLTLWQDPTSSDWLFDSGTSVPWIRASGVDGARNDSNVTLDTVIN